MPDANDLTETIAEEALLPHKSETDGQSAQGQPLPHLIAADKHLAAKAGNEGTNDAGGPVSGWRGLRAGRVIPPGGV